MGVLDKFSAVEIKNDNRISEEDKAFCQRQQEAFDKSAPALLAIAERMTAALKEQEAILGGDEDSVIGRYINGDCFHCNAGFVYITMEQRNKTFISAIVNYFARKYNVELDAGVVAEHLIPAPPKKPNLPWGGHREMTDEQIDRFKEKNEAYMQAETKHNEAMRTLPLRYEQIVDEIFVQLGGFSFQERAMNEMLTRCWNAGHRRDWRTDKTVEDFEVKNDTLKLLDSGYWCQCRDDSWRSYPEWSTSDDLKCVLEAVAHFQCGRMNEGHLWFPELFRYTTENNVFPINSMEKVRNIKLFKNGRVDIKFSSVAYAHEFAENYLRRYVE